jgi:hypothetical protein
MAYDASDPRSQLGSTGTSVATGANVAPQYFEFAAMDPGERLARGSWSWWARSQACVCNYVDARAGERLDRTGQPDEYMVLLADAGSTAAVRAGDELAEARGRALVVVPPGDSSVELHDDCRVVRLFTTRATELCTLAANEAFYAVDDPNVAPFQPWPDPPGGFRIRVYDLDAVPPEPGRFGRLYRCSTLMVNYFYEDPGPRDPSRLSPHHHDDFEQLSLQLGGDYVHHIRTPWTVDMAMWREDEHRHCTSPSLTVIPPPAVHTSQGVGDTPHQLVDVFCPPRRDFSERPGWVLNADEYPAPA